MSATAKPVIIPYIRSMLRRDFLEVISTEFESYVDPWSEGDLLDALKSRSVSGWVAEHDRRVVGHLVYEQLVDQVHVHRLAVAREYRRRGVGRCLAARASSRLGGFAFSGLRRTRAVTNVRESALDAQLFLRDSGYVGRLVRNAYGDEDGVHFVFSVEDSE